MAIRTSMIGGISPSDFSVLRNQLNDLQRQLGTARSLKPMAGLGRMLPSSINYRTQLSSIDAYQQTITDVTTRFSLIDKALSQFSTLISGGKSALRYDDFNLAKGQTIGQVANRDRLDQALGLLNTEVNGRYLFGGRDTQKPPVLDTDKVLKRGSGQGWLQHGRLAATGGGYGR